MNESGKCGQIVTFYSYKGGTGRSMLLANVAWILASNGKKVLVVDWDLEAPGVHRFFRPFLTDVDLQKTDGLIDFVVDFAVAATAPVGHDDAEDEDWFHAYADLATYSVPLRWDFPVGGKIDFVGAGRQGASYSSRVNGFNWQDFYERFGGGNLFERVRQNLKAAYDYILIDSRTGVSDTSGICTVQLPDVLVVCFTLNNQNVTGTSAVARSVRAQRKESLRILPVPTRVERSEKDKLNRRREDAMSRFSALLEGTSRGEQEEYWTDVEVLYEPYYAYEEVLATFKDLPGQRHTVLASAERLASRITGETLRALRISESRRQVVLADYEDAPLPARQADIDDQPQVLISYQRGDAGYAVRIYDRFAKVFGAGRTLMDVDANEPGVDIVDASSRAAQISDVVLVVIGPTTGVQQGVEEGFHATVASALKAGRRVVPVLVGGARLPEAAQLPQDVQPLVRRQAIEITEGRWNDDLNRLVAAVELAVVQEGGPAGPGIPSREHSARTSVRSDQLIDEVLKNRREKHVSRTVAIAIAAASVAVAVAVAAIGVGLLPPGSGSNPPAPAPPLPTPATTRIIAASVPIPAIGGQILVGSGPTRVAISPNGRFVYTTSGTASATDAVVTVVDTLVNKVVATIPISAGSAQDLAFAPDGSRLYVGMADPAGTTSGVAVLDTSTNSVVTNIVFGGQPQALAVAPDGSQLYVADYAASTVSTIDTRTNSLGAVIRVRPGPRSISVSPDGSRAYIACDQAGVVTVLDTSSRAVISELAMPGSPVATAIHPSGPLLAVVGSTSNTVAVFDRNAGQERANVAVGDKPQDVVWAPDGRFAYVVNGGSSSVSVISANTFAVTATIPTGDGPSSIALTPDGTRAYVSDVRSGTLTWLDLSG